MNMQRLPCLTNAFSKRAENHVAAATLHYMHNNFCRVHKGLRVTPTMQAAIAEYACCLEELVAFAL
jgi:hypothetical protein